LGISLKSSTLSLVLGSISFPRVFVSQPSSCVRAEWLHFVGLLESRFSSRSGSGSCLSRSNSFHSLPPRQLGGTPLEVCLFVSLVLAFTLVPVDKVLLAGVIGSFDWLL
jgi:hypothetical protein